MAIYAVNPQFAMPLMGKPMHYISSPEEAERMRREHLEHVASVEEKEAHKAFKLSAKPLVKEIMPLMLSMSDKDAIKQRVKEQVCSPKKDSSGLWGSGDFTQDGFVRISFTR